MNGLWYTAGIDDDDQEFQDYHWTYDSEKPGQRVTYPLNADRFWVQPDVLEGDASGRCVASGVRLTYGLVRVGGLISRINFVGVESMRWGGVR